MMNTKIKGNRFNFLRVAAAVPQLHLADPELNLNALLSLAKIADKEESDIIVFPEMSLTGYTAGDLFHEKTLIRRAQEALEALCQQSQNLEILMAVGLPLLINGKLFNVSAAISRGKIWGLVPKTFLPGYKEFYEERWFSSGNNLGEKEIILFGQKVPVGHDLIFKFANNSGAVLGIEICEDLWTPIPMSSLLAQAGANIILNLSASNELVGKAEYRKNLVIDQSARCLAAYIYTSSGVHESTTDTVFSGHALLAENGTLLEESERFKRESQIIIADIDIDRLINDRIKTTSFFETAGINSPVVFREVSLPPCRSSHRELRRYVNPLPFVPANAADRQSVCQDIFNIQSAGVAQRLRHSGIKKILIGLSGGLDSTLALLVAHDAMKKLGLPMKNIRALTMPGFGTTRKTKTNARKLAETLGVSLEEIDIKPGSRQQMKDIGHDGASEDTAFENIQARYRTMILMNKSNQEGGLVLGTGDLSEIALGWCAFNGDHISHYHVNAGVPKTLVKYLVRWVGDSSASPRLKEILNNILETPISPELTSSQGGISQKTEEIIGPYELHDFFLYHFIRWNEEPKKILFLAEKAFAKKYSRTEIKKWLRVFLERFFKNQWKRSVMPDGPKVGSVALSPRADWRMPSDAPATLWLKELN